MTRIYLDHSSATPIISAILPKVTRALQVYGNPSSMHSLGQDSKETIESVRHHIQHHVGGDCTGVFFSSATEANNYVLRTVARQSGACRILVSAIEHACVRATAAALADDGVDVQIIPVLPTGVVDIEALSQLITPNTALISVMMTNNETGINQPLDAVINVAKQHNVPVHTDAVQWVGKQPIPDLDYNYLVFSGHKLGAPKGCAVLCMRQVLLTPWITGGHQEHGVRAGTENVWAIAGLGYALTHLVSQQDLISAHYQTLNAQLRDQLNSGQIIWNTPESAMPHILNFSLLGHDAHTVVMAMDLQGIAIAAGSACSTGSMQLSPVISAMFPNNLERIQSAIRVSFGPCTTADDITAFATAIRQMMQVSN
tara:strand:- start:13952 stop:15061 length:1110 start_codon:yes stop_codon:yes gene_type:complete